MDLYKQSDRKFRSEIEGLRAVASILVAIYHIWLGNVSGGVDVFFVVSGFLITTSLLNRYERKGKIDFSGFILRLANRLFPASFTILFIVTIACIIWLPQVQWDQTAKELFATALYFENWQLAFNSVDYLAQNNEASPFQHFWASSIQGQFYIIWPILLFISILLSKYVCKKSVRFTFLMTMIVVFCLSFLYSIYLTNINQPWAYFDTFTRVWEFSIGGMVALLISNIVIRKSISIIIGWLGLIGLISCGLILQVSTVFPGYAALWPTISAVFILFAGNQGGSFGVHRLLSAKPLVKFGAISFGFYLWHWPLLIFYYIVTSNETVSLFDGLVIILFAALLSFLTTSLIEKPVRNQKRLNTKWASGLSAIAFMTPVLLLFFIWSGTIQKQYAELADMIGNENYPGAAVLSIGTAQAESDVPIAPTPVQVRNDLPKVYGDGCHQAIGKSEVLQCTYGVTDNPDYTVALVGGSHSAHWLPGLKGFAEKEKIKIVTYTKSGCRFSVDENAVEDCQEWNEKLMDILLSNKPDLIFTTADATELDEVPKGFTKAWETLNEANIPVFAVRDNPRFSFDVPSCVEENGSDSTECYIERENIVPTEGPWSKLENPPSNVHYVDLSDSFCGKEYCKPVVGNVLVYRDSHHLSATYARTLAPIIREKLMPILES